MKLIKEITNLIWASIFLLIIFICLKEIFYSVSWVYTNIYTMNIPKVYWQMLKELTFLFFNFYLFTYFYEAKGINVPSTGLLLNCLQQLGLGRAKIKSQKFNQNLPHRWQGPTIWSITCLPEYPLARRRIRNETRTGI